MMLLDVNILVNAHRKDAPHHALLRGWLEDLINGDQAYGIADIVLSGFLRVVTHTTIFNPPSGMSDALAFCKEVRDQPHCVHISPGPRHWEVFTGLLILRPLRSNPEANGLQRIATTAALPSFVGVIHN